MLQDNYTFIRYAVGQASNSNTTNTISQPSLTSQMSSTLSSINVSQSSINYILDQMRRDKTVHVTFDTQARKYYEHVVKSSPYLMEFIVRMFYWDYKLFGYEIPLMSFHS